MNLKITIPKEFENDFRKDKFNDLLQRVLVGIKCSNLCGMHEKESLYMLLKAFENAVEESDEE